MPWLDRPDEDSQLSPMPVSQSVLRLTAMAFLTTANALPSKPVRTPPEEKQGATGWAGAAADAPKADAAAARPTGGDTEALQSEMDPTLDLYSALLEEHLPKAVTSMGLHLSMLPSAAGVVMMIFKANKGAQLPAMLSAHPKRTPVPAGCPCETPGSSFTPLGCPPFRSFFSTISFVRGLMSSMSAGHHTLGCITGTMG